MRVVPCALLAVLFTLPASGPAAERVFKWTDERGVTHYSDSPPPGVRYQDVHIRQRDSGRGGADTAGTADAPEATLRAENCQRARQNLEILQRSPRVSMDLNGDGQAEPLDATERAHQIELAAEQLRRFCEG
ncbi:MAG: DUF4124 domain-containing protein [Rehaibacterium terrae]|uniref:DUF4124 domain-containing protein n=1 Tax=Rehaibacterium terrae TaxID=1341696 RepID=UPI00391B1A29